MELDELIETLREHMPHRHAVEEPDPADVQAWSDAADEMHAIFTRVAEAYDAEH